MHWNLMNEEEIRSAFLQNWFWLPQEIRSRRAREFEKILENREKYILVNHVKYIEV